MKAGSEPNADLDEWRDAVAEPTEFERAPYDDPQTYADTMTPDGDRI